MSVFDQFSAEELTILKQRADRVARSSHDDEQNTIVSALTVQLHDENYAIPIDDLTAVYTEGIIVPVPWTPPYVSGIANIRGRIVTVLNLGILLDIPDHNSLELGPLIVASNDELTLAFGVSKVGDVLNFAGHEIEPVPQNLEGKHISYYQGVLRDGTTVLNIKAILSDPGLIVADGMSAD